MSLPAATGWFTQTFTQLVLHVTDTGELFTLSAFGGRLQVQRGRHVRPRRRASLAQWLGFDPGRWWAEQFVMPLDSSRLRVLTTAFAHDLNTPQGQYAVVAPMLWPLLE